MNLPLKLRPAEAGEIVPLPAEGSNQLQSETQDGLRLVLEHVAADHGKTVFQVSLRYDQPNTWIGAPWNVTLSDEDGALYPLTDVTPDTMTSGDIHVYQTVPFSGSEQLVLTLVTFPPSDSIPMFIDLSADSPSFDFDLGADAQVGQTWNLNQLLSYGDFNLKVIRATLDNGPRLVFEIEPGPSVTGAMFYTPDPLVTGSSGGVPVKSGNVTAGMTFSAIPQHPIEVRLMRIYCQKRGSWKIRWQPPAAPAAATNAPTQTVAPPLVHLPTPTLAISNPTLLEVQQLAKKFDSPFQQGPGWVHIVAESRTKLETITEPRAGQTFPPPYIKTEQWIEVDQDGYITRSVWLDYDDAGTMIQQTATVGNYSVNFTMGFSGFNEGTASRFSMDMLSRDLSGAIQRGSRLLREELTCEGGKSCLLISMFDNLEQSVTNPGETQAFSGSGRRVWIDLETGQQVKSQSFWLLEDGSEKITSTTSYLLVEKVDSAPQGILDVLKRVIVQ